MRRLIDVHVVPNPLDPQRAEAQTAIEPAPVAEGPPRLGNYELLRRLGQGGMAEVHLARAAGMQGFQKLVVLKRILPHLAADPEFVRMFLAEGRIAAFLEHPNIVQIFDIGTAGADYFLAMEYVYGENLRTILRAARARGEALPIEHAVAIGIGVALGLHDAHEAVGFDGTPLHLVHRDVSPTNILVSYDGAVKVADFGIAKMAARTDVTQAGIRKGKVPFMSPEQCLAAPLDRRSDVFSLGIVLYEATTMQRLFDGDNEFVIINQIMNGMVPPPSTRRPGYPKALERIVMKALARDRHNRYASAAEVAADLEQFAFEHKLRATQASLGAYMHRVFAPKPFPFGALSENPAPERDAEDSGSWAWGFDSARAGSQPSVRVMGSEPVVDRESHASRRTPASQRSRAPSSPGEVATDDTLRKIVTAVGAAAAFAVVLVAGAWLYLSTRAASREIEVPIDASAAIDASGEAPPVVAPAPAPLEPAQPVVPAPGQVVPAPGPVVPAPGPVAPAPAPVEPAVVPAPPPTAEAPASDASIPAPVKTRRPKSSERRKRERKRPAPDAPAPKPSKRDDLDSFFPFPT